MSQLLVCRMNRPSLAVSGSLTVDCPQPEQCDLTAEFLNSVNVVGSCPAARLVCGPLSGATSAAVACGPTGALGSDMSLCMACARASRCARVGTNGLLLVAA